MSDWSTSRMCTAHEWVILDFQNSALVILFITKKFTLFGTQEMLKKKGICNLHRICNYDSIENYVVTVSCLFHMWDIRFISIRNSGISWHLYNKCVIVAYILLCKFNFFRKWINISFVTCFRILLMIHPNSLYIFMLVLS
jgi:hypothetical protein